MRDNLPFKSYIVSQISIHFEALHVIHINQSGHNNKKVLI